MLTSFDFMKNDSYCDWPAGVFLKCIAAGDFGREEFRLDVLIEMELTIPFRLPSFEILMC